MSRPRFASIARLARASAALALVPLALACARGGARGGSESAAPAAGAPPVTPATAERILADLRTSDAPVTLVNVWATWCVPCREEFPDLLRLHRDYRDRGLALVLVSADFEDQMPEVQRFLAERGVDFATYLKTGDDLQFIDGLSPRWSGSLPATFVYDGAGTLRHFREGKATYEQFERQVLDVLESPPDAASQEERS